MSLGVLKTNNITGKEPVQTISAPPTALTNNIDRVDGKSAAGSEAKMELNGTTQPPLALNEDQVLF